MKIFSTIGAALGGPAGAAIGAIGDAVVGGISERNQVKRQNALEMDKFARLREASLRGGYHPLETLRAGGYVDATAVPRLMSTIAGSNAFDALSDEITGEAAASRQRQAVDDEIRELERDRLKYEVAQRKIGQASLDTGLPGGSPRVGGPNDLEAGRETATNPYSRDAVTGNYANPFRADAEAWEARGGELPSWFAGFKNLLDDGRYNNFLRQKSYEMGISISELHRRFVDRGATYYALIQGNAHRAGGKPRPGRIERMSMPGAPPGSRFSLGGPLIEYYEEGIKK